MMCPKNDYKFGTIGSHLYNSLKFSDEEVATVRKFFDWIVSEGWLESRYSSGEGLTGADDAGVTVTDFSAVSDYDSYSLEKDETFIPWIALTNPEKYKRQCEAEEAERKRQQELAQQRAEAQRSIQQEAQERAFLAALKAKYEA